LPGTRSGLRTLSSPRSEQSLLSKVLIVDDDGTSRQAVRSLFEGEAGFDVCGEAVNGLDALAKANHLSPDIIVLDLSMPVMNGLEAAELLKLILPRVPIFMLTVHSGPEVQGAAQAAGVDAVFSKSEDLSRLITRAKAVLHAE